MILIIQTCTCLLLVVGDNKELIIFIINGFHALIQLRNEFDFETQFAHKINDDVEKLNFPASISYVSVELHENLNFSKNFQCIIRILFLTFFLDLLGAEAETVSEKKYNLIQF